MVPLKLLKTRLLIALLLFLSVWLTYQYMESMLLQSSVEKEKFPQLSGGKKVLVTVFYECLCPDSKSFIHNHLLPSFEKAPHLLQLHLIPYGKAETRLTSRGSYEFECQHGSSECFGNKVHACAINKVEDEMKSLRVISCLMEDHGDIEGAGAECSTKFGVNWGPILDCAKGKEGNDLLKEHGDSTNALNPKISFVPTILLNHKRDGQPAILKNLWKEICRILPEAPECK
uniref:Gamma-interferon-inducible lysosomal thiol reductase n=1 Tax=Homalodisca liturata TaxID=320908 RepID=A0A1B6K2I2_9HEMI